MIRFLLILILALPLRGAERYDIITPTTTNAAIYTLEYGIGFDGFDSANRIAALTIATNIAISLTNGSYNNWIRTNNNRIRVVAILTNSASNGSGGYSAPQSSTPFGGYISGASVLMNSTYQSTIFTEVGADQYYPIVVLNRGDYAATTSGLYRIGMTTNSDLNIVLHETGHSVAGLGEEYASNWTSTFANSSSDLTSATNKWLVTFPSLGAPVSISTGYKPTATCKMNVQSDGFCVVCSNEFVRILGWTNFPAALVQQSVGRINIGTLQFR